MGATPTALPLQPSQDVFRSKTPILAQPESGNALQATLAGLLIDPRHRDLKQFGYFLDGKQAFTR